MGQDGGGSAQINPTDEEWRWGLSLLKKIKTLVPKEGVYWSGFASIILCNKQPQHSLACLNNKWVLVGWVHVCFTCFSHSGTQAEGTGSIWDTWISGRAGAPEK